MNSRFAYVFDQARPALYRKARHFEARFGNAVTTATSLVHDLALELHDRKLENLRTTHFRAKALRALRYLASDKGRAAATRGLAGRVGVSEIGQKPAEQPAFDPDDAALVARLQDDFGNLGTGVSKRRRAVISGLQLGMTKRELAKQLEVSVATIDRDVAVIRARLQTLASSGQVSRQVTTS